MSKFVIECPKCGKFTEASSGGLFGIGKTKTVDCVCGYTINIATDKMTSKVCPHCKNQVIYDQSKGEKAICPVCHGKINTREGMDKLVDFTCPTCFCLLSADKNAEEYTCPLCETKIRVQERLAKLAAKNKGIASVIKFEGSSDVFVWKHPIEDFNLGSQLIVHESQIAFFYRDGKALDRFPAGRYTLATQNLPLLENLYKLPTNTDEVFHSEIYFVNTAVVMGLKWGTDSRVRFIEPQTGIPLDIGASGELNLAVSDPARLLFKLVGTTSGLAKSDIFGEDGNTAVKGLRNYFRAPLMTEIKSCLGAAIKEQKINILEIDQHLSELSDALRARVSPKFEEYGLTVPDFFVTNVSLPDDDPNFREIRRLITDTYLGVRRAESEAAILEAERKKKIVAAQTEDELTLMKAQREANAARIRGYAEADIHKAQGLAEAEVMQNMGYSKKDVIEADVQKAYAESLGKLGSGSTVVSGGTPVSGGLASDMVGMMTQMKLAGMVMDKMDDLGFPGNVKSKAEPAPAAPTAPAAPAAGGWTCPACGAKDITSKFCPECGAKKPEPAAAWDCPACGAKGITSKFCPECGAKKPEPAAAWDCPACGAKGITSKFCPECGAKKPEPAADWTCPDCGTAGITGKFCPECGRKRDN